MPPDPAPEPRMFLFDRGQALAIYDDVEHDSPIWPPESDGKESWTADDFLL